MTKFQSKAMWEMLCIPKTAIARRFTSEKVGRDLYEIVIPDNVPDVADSQL